MARVTRSYVSSYGCEIRKLQPALKTVVFATNSTNVSVSGLFEPLQNAPHNKTKRILAKTGLAKLYVIQGSNHETVQPGTVGGVYVFL